MPRQSNLRYSVQPLVGDAAFEVVSFTLDEALSTPFKLNLELVSADADVACRHGLVFGHGCVEWRKRG